MTQFLGTKNFGINVAGKTLLKKTADNAKLRQAVHNTPLNSFQITIRVPSPILVEIPSQAIIQLEENEILVLVLNSLA